jgi:hypothetical protein
MEYLVDGQPILFFLMELAVPQELITTAIRRRTATTDNTFFFIALYILV